MDFSIVVPFHNEETHLEQAINALLSQDYPEDLYEIIMVDDRSTDRSVEIVRQHPRIRLLESDERGDFAARNHGIAEAKGEIIAFTDADTAPARDWLRNAAQGMQDPSVEIIVGGLRFDPDSRSLAMIADYESSKNEFVFSSDTKEIYYGYTCNLIVRKSLFDTLGPFPPVYRNSDVVFVRQVVNERSCDAVRYCLDVSVQRLEISTLRAYFAKQHTYGRDFARYRELIAARPLNTRERLRVFKETIATREGSRLTSTALFLLLLFGAFCYELGRLRREPSRNGQVVVRDRVS